MTSPAGLLHTRLSDCLGAHDIDDDTSDAILTGYAAAGGEEAGWDDLDGGTQALIVYVESSLPRTAWDDPDDVPANVDDDF